MSAILFIAAFLALLVLTAYLAGLLGKIRREGAPQSTTGESQLEIPLMPALINDDFYLGETLHYNANGKKFR